MAVAEILYTKTECFNIHENGYVDCIKGKFTPSQPRVFDVYAKPDRPEECGWSLVDRNIWGQELYREDLNIRDWKIKCEEIDRKNAEAHKKQIKDFKIKLLKVRRAYHRQERRRILSNIRQRISSFLSR